MTNKHRLPSHITPSRYELVLKPNLDKFVFDGQETIFLKISKPTKTIILHAKELAISDVSLKISNSKYQISKQIQNPKSETVTFTFKQKIPAGEGELSLKFTGVLNDKMRGFYRSRYIHEGVEKHLATTQFEATDARRAFPCFDEPSSKAIFDVSVIVPVSQTVVSNSIELDSEIVPEHGEGYKLVKFAPTPKMSTYLLAFIVGDLEHLEAKTKRGVVVRVFTTPGKKHQAKFALDCAVKTLDYYEKYFDINYPLPLLDMIAIPDFTSGAMENWGAITYRESALLVDEQNSSAQNKQWVALVIAHEIAHQWFGNLVTMHWWTDLWLNEGFASYIEYLAVDHIFPHWNIWTQFMTADFGPALRLDALANTHPIEVEVKHSDEIGEIFDAVSYSKGATVIRMLAEYLGEKDFQNGLRLYLKKHSYKNTQTTDLWKAFELVSKKPVIKMMQSWTKKPGYPIVKVQVSKQQLNLTQSRFFSSRLFVKNNQDKTLWQIPILSQNDKQSQKILLSTKQANFKLVGGSWFKLNKNETSLLRVKYPKEILEKLKPLVTARKLSPIDRLGLVRDLFALAESGHVATTDVLDFVLVYKNETEYTVWVEIIGGLNKLENLLYDNLEFENFRKFSQELLVNVVKQVGWVSKKHEPYAQGLLRGLVLYSAGSFGHKQTVVMAKKIFKQKNIKPDIRSAVYRLVAETGSAKEYQTFIDMYKNSELHEEKNRIATALGCFKQKNLLAKTLQFSKSKFVRAQDMPGFLVSTWQNSEGKNLTWDFVKENIAYLMDRFALGGHMLARILSPASNFTSSSKALEIKQFFQKHPSPGTARTIEQVLEKIYSNQAWLNDEQKNIEAWLSKYYEK